MDIIREDFFHFLWQNLHFNQSGLLTTCGKEVYVLHPGYRNDGDGADYRFSRILLDGMLFCGDVELHKMASEWYRHGHQRDSRYERVILHVVVHDDLHKRMVLASDGHRVPTLEMRTALPDSLARLWRAWHRPVSLPCSGLVADVPGEKFQSVMSQWDRRYFRHRLARMLEFYPADITMSTAWQRMLVRGLFQGLGYHKNQDPMLEMADFFLEKYYGCKEQAITASADPASPGPATADWILQTTESLLSEAGLADGCSIRRKRLQWDFSASRPANRPDSRLPQAAELSHRILHMPITSWLHGSAETLWQDSCRLEIFPAPGEQRNRILFHNVLLPSLYYLGRWLHSRRLVRQVVQLWDSQHIPLPPKVKKTLETGGFPAGRHLNRLAILHHFKYFCGEKRCCECRIMKYFVRA
jgi:hypothetical protein